MRMARRLVIALMLTASLGMAQTPKLPLVGIQPGEPTGGFGPGGWEKNMQHLVDLGQGLLPFSLIWDQMLETQPRQIDLQYLDMMLHASDQFKLPILLVLHTITTNVNALPADLKSKHLDDPEVLARFKTLLDDMVPRFKGRVPWLMIGNEVDVYFQDQPAALVAFDRFYAAAYQEIKRLAPEVQVGLTFTYDGIRQHPEIFKTLGPRGDVNCLTYYPMGANFQFEDPSVADRDIGKMGAIVGSKKFILSEIGYGSAPSLGSSEAKQAEFYRNVFQALRKHRDHLVAAVFLHQRDWSTKTCDDFAVWYRMGGKEFKDYLCSLGIMDQNARPKEAWKTFQEEMRRFTGH